MVKNVKKIDESINDIFFAREGEQVVYFLCDSLISGSKKYENMYRNEVFSQIIIEPELEINGEMRKNVSIVTFKSINEEETEILNDIFISIYKNRENLSRQADEVYEMVVSLIIAIKNKKINQERKEIGLIGELLTLVKLESFIPDVHNKLVGNVKARFDISLDEETKIEVKTTTSKLREHMLKFSQMIDRENIYFSSVMLEMDDSGLSLFDITQKYDSLISKIEMTKRLEIIEYAQLSRIEPKIKVNIDRTFEKIMFFNAKEILTDNIIGGSENTNVVKTGIIFDETKSIDIEKELLNE